MSKAFRFHRHGGPEVLGIEDVEVGAPGPGQVRMRNKAVAVNYRDILMRRGVHVVKSLPSGIGPLTPNAGGGPFRSVPCRRW